MKRLLLGGMFVVLFTGAADAQDIQFQFAGFKDVSTAFASQEREIDELRDRLISVESYQGDFVGPSECEGDAWCNPCAGVVFAAEVVWLRPQDSEPNSVSSTEFQTGSRFTLGWMNDSGRTLRMRYYEFRHDDFDGNELDQEIIDIEYAGRFRLGCNWRGELMGGARWASYQDNDNTYQDTGGPVVGIEIRGDVGYGLDVFGLVRQSYQFGKERSDEELGSFGISEVQLGLEYQTCVRGHQIFARGMVEAQQWSGVEDNDSEDLGLIGFGLAFGITR